MPEIVPVELSLPSGRWYTLYQRGWEDADDDSLAFLGTDERVFGFATPDELASYAGSSEAIDGHHLADSPLWGGVRHRFLSDFQPATGDRYDIPAGPGGENMLAELCFFLRVEPPADDPLRASLPQPGSLTGLPAWLDRAAPPGADRLGWALEQVDARVGAPGQGSPAPADGAAAAAAEPIEQVAPGVAVLWLGLASQGAFTLVWHGDDGETDFLGEPGELRAASAPAALAAYVARGTDGFLALAPWAALRGLDDLDYEPYEDDVTDLDEVAGLIGADLDRLGAQRLAEAWGLLRSLADHLAADEALAALSEDAPLGRFVVRDVLDLAAGSERARLRLADLDPSLLQEAWQDCVAVVADHLVWVDGP